MDRETQWKNLMLRLKREAEKTLAAHVRQEAGKVLSNNKQRGIAIITMHVLMQADGTPILWVVPEGKRVEPSKDAAEILRGIVDVL